MDELGRRGEGGMGYCQGLRKSVRDEGAMWNPEGQKGTDIRY